MNADYIAQMKAAASFIQQARMVLAGMDEMYPGSLDVFEIDNSLIEAEDKIIRVLEEVA